MGFLLGLDHSPQLNTAPFFPQCRSPRLPTPPWRSRPARQSCATPVATCAKGRFCVCRTSTSTSSASSAKVSPLSVGPTGHGGRKMALQCGLRTGPPSYHCGPCRAAWEALVRSGILEKSESRIFISSVTFSVWPMTFCVRNLLRQNRPAGQGSRSPVARVLLLLETSNPVAKAKQPAGLVCQKGKWSLLAMQTQQC